MPLWCSRTAYTALNAPDKLWLVPIRGHIAVDVTGENCQFAGTAYDITWPDCMTHRYHKPGFTHKEPTIRLKGISAKAKRKALLKSFPL